MFFQKISEYDFFLLYYEMKCISHFLLINTVSLSWPKKFVIINLLVYKIKNMDVSEKGMEDTLGVRGAFDNMDVRDLSSWFVCQNTVVVGVRCFTIRIRLIDQTYLETRFAWWTRYIRRKRSRLVDEHCRIQIFYVLKYYFTVLFLIIIGT